MRFYTWSCIAMLALLVACDDDKPPPKTADDVPQPTKTAEEKGDEKPDKDDVDTEDNEAGVEIDNKVMKMCDLPEARFGFDSSTISATAKKILKLVAKCFNDGPGKGHSLNIVGHTDPRGPDDYNRILGQKRAGAVATYLTTVGLAENRIESSSQGELHATGTDLASWAKDRRVEILLAE